MILSIIALAISVLSFLVGFFWNRKTSKMQIFAQMIEQESRIASEYAQSKRGKQKKDALISYFNFFDGLAHLYFANMLPRKVTKKYFREIIAYTAKYQRTNIPEGCETLHKLLKKWDI